MSEQERSEKVGRRLSVVRSAVGMLLSMTLASCDDEDSGGGEAEASSTQGASSSSGLDCFSGEFGCPCEAGGLCAPGLVCAEGTCEEFGGAESSDGSSTGSETGGGVDDCAGSFECDESEVCVFETCTPISAFNWKFRVTEFTPGGCRDGWGGAEVFYRYLENGVEVEESPVSGCPAEWSSLDPGFYSYGATFELEFWELDVLFNDFFTRLCWTDPVDEDVCGPVPDIFLHQGGFFGSLDGEHTVEVIFEPEL
jgi:hypothetical protein